MADRKEYIERGAAYEIIETEGKRIGMTVCNRLNCKELLLRVPTADVVEVVRCKDCKYYIPPDEDDFLGECINGSLTVSNMGEPCPERDYFCPFGERGFYNAAD